MQSTKRTLSLDAVFDTGTVEIPMLTSGEAADILGIKMWRLERFLENYPLSAGQPGRGKGTRRLFSTDDIRRLGIAKWLLDDRFQPKLVAAILERLEGEYLIEREEHSERYPCVVMERDPESGKRTWDIRRLAPEEKVPAGKNVYYALNFEKVIDEMDRRIKSALEKRRKR